MRTLGLDVKYALRANLQRPWLAGLIVLTLALGLGANAAVLAMVDERGESGLPPDALISRAGLPSAVSKSLRAAA